MNVLLQILQTVVLISLLIVGVWLIDRMTGKKAGYRWRKVLWLILAIRLIFPVPIQISDVIDSFKGVEVTVNIPEQFSGAPVKNTEIPVNNTNTINVDNNTFTETEDVALNQNKGYVSSNVNVVEPKKGIPVVGIIVVVWLTISAILLLIRYFQYRFMKKEYLSKSEQNNEFELDRQIDSLRIALGIKKFIPVRVIKEINIINSPMLFGYFNTVLLLPNIFYTADEMDSIIRHELTHYRSRDLWYKLLFVIVCDIYWFNPLFRLMKNMAFHDVECVCDEKVTRNMDLDTKKDYGSTILKTMSGMKVRNYTFTTQFAGTKKNAKKRLENIFSSKNRKAAIVVFSLFVLVLAFGTACVSVGVSKKDNTETDKAKEKSTITIDSTILAEQGDTLLADMKEKYPDYDITTTDLVYDGTEEFFNNAPTVFSVANTNTLALAQAGKVADITDILSEKGWLEQMNDILKETVSDENGRIYGIPCSPYVYGLMANVKIFKEAGLTDDNGVPVLPTTWDELADTAVKIKNATGKAGISLIAGDYAGSMQFCNMAWNFGAVEFGGYDEDGKYKACLDSVGVIKAMQYIKDLKWKYDVLTEDPTKEDYLTVFENLANETAAMCIGANDAVYTPVSYGMEPEDIAMGAIPAGPNGNQYSLYDGPVYVFSADTKPEEIKIILSLLEKMGLGPVANDANKERVQNKIQSSVDIGAPTTREIPVWNNTEILSYEQSLIEETGNTNQALYEDYFDKILSEGNLKGLDVVLPSTLCDELATVLKKVVTDKDADVTQLMKTANDNWQKAIDANY